jgi:hypothetical protein
MTFSAYTAGIHFRVTSLIARQILLGCIMVASYMLQKINLTLTSEGPHPILHALDGSDSKTD